MYAFGVTVSMVAFRPIDSAAAAAASDHVEVAADGRGDEHDLLADGPGLLDELLRRVEVVRILGEASKPWASRRRSPTQTDSVVQRIVTSP